MPAGAPDRRRRLLAGGLAAGALALAGLRAPSAGRLTVRLALAGDVMTGRGIDQVLPHPGDPRLRERFMRSALDYVSAAERLNGPIPRPAPWQWIWGDALAELEAMAPAARVVNLETAITARGTPAAKGIHYRMHPANVRCLTVAGIDCCVLANNHVLDWGRRGLDDTLEVLRGAGMATAGAGHDAARAAAPAVLAVGGTRLLVFAFALPTSGVPASWAARPDRRGVSWLPDLSAHSFARVAAIIDRRRRPGDLVMVSLHWGGNWGWAVTDDQRRFAHHLIDEAGVDVVHGHSSHHPKAIEVHRERLVLYGCGDLINDYEGIPGREAYRPELGLMYFPLLDAASGALRGLEMTPLRRRRLRLERAEAEDRCWLERSLDRECRAFGCGVRGAADGRLRLAW